MFDDMDERVIASRYSIIALITGAIGAFGQAYLFYHELVDCLPYKEIDGAFYKNIALVGVAFGPILAVGIGAIFRRRQFWLSVVLPVVLTPILFALIFKMFNVAYGYRTSAAPDDFGDFTTAKAAEQFFSYCVSLGATGFVIGAVVALLLRFVAIPRKLA